MGREGGAVFCLPLRELGDSPRAAPSPSRCAGSLREPRQQGSHDTRAWEPPGPPFDVGCAASSKSVRTSSCPGQETAARRPPGSGATLHALPRPFRAQPGKGSQESLNPLEICSDQKPGLATPGEKWVRSHAGLPAGFPPPSDPVCSLPSIPYGSYLAQSKWGCTDP